MLKNILFIALLGSMAGQVNVTPLPPPKTCLESAGSILSGGSVSTFAAGTTTPLASYTDSTGTVPNANPIVLDSSGCANIWLGPSSYKIVVKKSDGTTVYTTDGINGAFLNFLSLNGANALTAIADPAASLGKFWLSLTTTGRLKWSDASAIHTVVGADTTDTETNKTLVNPAVTGNVKINNTPSATWTVDGAQASSLITITNNGTYDLAAGAGMVIVHSDTAGTIGLFVCAAGSCTIVSDPAGAFSVASGTAAHTNLFYNGTTAYRIENKTGGSVNYYVVMVRSRVSP